jgi:hypothetical protein
MKTITYKYLQRDVKNLEFRLERILENLDTSIINKDNSSLTFKELTLKTDINRIKDFIEAYK